MFSYEYWGNNTLDIKANMAMEEYLLDRSEKEKVATVRFWNVARDAIVLGYSEATSNIKKLDCTFDVARRITGGSHVEFDMHSLAYSFTVPRDGSFGHFEDMRAYFAEKVAAALIELGVDDVSIDNRASTINVDGKVIASHAIFWGVKSALMHGLMLIDSYDVDKIYERVLLKERKIGKKVYTEYSALKNAPTLSSQLQKEIKRIDAGHKREYVKRLVAEEMLKQIAGERFEKKAPSTEIVSNAESVVAARHTGSPWFNERRPPYTKGEVEAIPGEELDGLLRKRLGYCLYIEVSDKDFAKMSVPKED